MSATEATDNKPIKPSWRKLIEKGVVKRTDRGMEVKLSAIRIVPGFNLRDTSDPAYAVGLETLYVYMKGGGRVPPLEVALSADGEGVDIVEGHRRTAIYNRLVEEGEPIEWIRIDPFEGNALEKSKRILSSQENSKLKPVEVAKGYARLASFNLKPDEIAIHVHKTRQHVEQMLILANALPDVQAMVRDEVVSAAIAIETVRKHGEGAGEVLAKAHEQAKAKGATKVTAKTIAPRALPAKVVTEVVSAFDEFAKALPADARKAAAEAWAANEKGQTIPTENVTIPAFVLAELLAAHGAVEEERNRQATKERQKAERAAQKEIEGLRPKFPAAEGEAAAAEEGAAAK